MKNFELLGLPSELVAALQRMAITVPTPIQAEAIPSALRGLDILASAQTGTGKTVAYAIPLIAKLLDNPRAVALILAPTRELAVQVQKTFMQILQKESAFSIALLIGGAPMAKQMKELKRRPRLLIGTPGRVYDHAQRGTLALGETNFLVIDEADRMLDMGFQVQLERIVEFLPSVRQTLMFSATVSSSIERLSSKYLSNPCRISVGSPSLPAPKIKQEIIHTSATKKFSLLLTQLDQREGSILVFVKTRRGVDRLSKDLKQKGYSVDAIHGDLPQRRRDRVIESFRSQRSRIMIATDVAARGLDIPHLRHVINLDLPQCPEDYIHRIGRTGRAGAEGNALCFISPEDTRKWKEICLLMSPKGAPTETGSTHGARTSHPESKHRKRRFFKKAKHSRSWKQKSAFKI